MSDDPTMPAGRGAAARLARALRDPRLILHRANRVRERWRGMRRRRAMREALRQVRPVPVAAWGDVQVHVLTSHRYVDDSLCSLHSFYRFAPAPYPLVIHDWGAPDRLQPADVETLVRHFPGARVLLRAQADEAVEGELRRRGLDRCVEARRAEHLGLKLFDVDHYGAGKRVLFFDSDILFHRPPGTLFEALAETDDRWQDRYLVDVTSAYTWTEADVRRATGEPLPPVVNTGIYAVRADTTHWELFERALAVPRPIGVARLIEQTLRAIELGQRGAVPLPDDYDVSYRYAWGLAWGDPRRDQRGDARDPGRPVVTQHYCGDVRIRDMFYADLAAATRPLAG